MTSIVKQKSYLHSRTSKVEIMPASVDSIPRNSFVAAKFGAPKKKPYTVERIMGIDTLYLPDRTVYCGVGTVSSPGIVLDSFDVCFPLCPLSNPEMLKAMGYNHMMVLPQHPDAYYKRNKHIKIFSDSGGFQLSKGVEEFIDPDKLVNAYHKHIDYGIGLDIPLSRHLQDTEWFMRMARVTALNNKYIASHLKKKNSPAQIYDVSHGLTLPNRRKFTEYILKHKSGVGLALGGIGQATYDTAFTSQLMAVINLAASLDLTKGEYDRYHVLGTTNPFMLSIYVLLTEIGLAPFITSDSSTYTQSAIKHTGLGIRYAMSNKVAAYPITPKPLSFMQPCNCPVCFVTGNPLAYKVTPASNSVHGLHSMQQLFVLVSEVTLSFFAGHTKLDELVEFVAPSGLKDLCKAIFRFVLDLDKGFDPAWKIHKSTLESFLRKSSEQTGLFNSSSMNARHVAAGKVTTKAIERYEEFHGIRK